MADSGFLIRRPWVLVVVLVGAATSTAFMQTLVVPIQNHLPDLIDAPRSSTAWVLTISLLVAAVTTPISGRLADIFGMRTVMIALLAMMTVGSLIAAISSDLLWLLVGRGLQGVSMGATAVGISIMGLVDNGKIRIAGISLISSSMGFGGAIGLPLAAWIAEIGDWKLLFWTTAALGALILIAVVFVVPSTTRLRQRFDWCGALMLSAGLSGILVAISQGPVWGWASAATLGLSGSGVVLLVVWGVHELRTRDPLIDLRIMSKLPLLMVSLGSIAFGFALFVQEVSFLQILELPTRTEAGLGLSVLWASMALVPASLAMMAVAPLAATITDRYGARVTAVVGAVTSMVGYLISVVWHAEVWHIVVASVFALAGVAMGYAAIPTLVMAEVPYSMTSSAIGVNALMRSVGTSSGATITGMVLAVQLESSAGFAAPSPGGFVATFWLGVAAAALAAVLFWIPGRRR
ncbi:MFS transporter [Brevibacterium zhoupengii]|uniref:MFS transporter n=1 Tax=Brevibacterium zhoupengii TaxID=2898795 RepID=UPI001E5DAB43|nr:MFS transporter [Brevibacterium zhoupengii]